MKILPQLRCIAIEGSAQHWAHPRLEHSSGKMEAHLGTVDAIRLFKAGHKAFCLSGARDRKIALWDLSSTCHDDPAKNSWECTAVEEAHNGWIWSIAVEDGDQQFFSGGYGAAGMSRAR